MSRRICSLLVLVAAVIIALAGCGEDEPSRPPTTVDTTGVDTTTVPPVDTLTPMALAIGNKWVMEETEIKIVHWYYEFDTVVTVDSLQIVGTEELDGQTWYHATGGPLLYQGYYRHDSLGLWRRFQASDPSVLVAKYPATPGDTFSLYAMSPTPATRKKCYYVGGISRVLYGNDSLTTLRYYHQYARGTIGETDSVESFVYAANIGPFSYNLNTEAPGPTRWDGFHKIRLLRYELH